MLITTQKTDITCFFSVENPVDNVNNFFIISGLSLHNIFKIPLLFC